MVGTVLRTRSGVLVAIALLGATALAAADGVVNEQRLTLELAGQEVVAGQLVTVTVNYDSNESRLAGVAVRLHYDSSKLALEESRLLFSPASVGQQDQEDLADTFTDGNTATDRRYLAAWADLWGAWPGSGVTLPLALVELRFRAIGGPGSTSLSLTGSGCGGCRVVSDKATLNVVSGELTQAVIDNPTPLPTAPAPTPTTTPTPGPPEMLRDTPGGGKAPNGLPPTVAIPTLSEVGSIVLGALLAMSAVGVLLRRRG